MIIKEQVFNELSVFMKMEYNKIRHKINRNKWEFKKLAKEQTVLKRKLVELNDLYQYCIKRENLEKEEK